MCAGREAWRSVTTQMVDPIKSNSLIVLYLKDCERSGPTARFGPPLPSQEAIHSEETTRRLLALSPYTKKISSQGALVQDASGSAHGGRRLMQSRGTGPVPT